MFCAVRILKLYRERLFQRKKASLLFPSLKNSEVPISYEVFTKKLRFCLVGIVEDPKQFFVAFL